MFQKRTATSGFDAERTPCGHDERCGFGTDGRDRGRRYESGVDDRRHKVKGGTRRRGRRRVHSGRQRGHTAEFRQPLCQVYTISDQKVPHLCTGVYILNYVLYLIISFCAKLELQNCLSV